jgi:hypothetical protein
MYTPSKRAIYQRNLRADRATQGLCTICGVNPPSTPTRGKCYKQCKTCRYKHSKSNRPYDAACAEVDTLYVVPAGPPSPPDPPSGWSTHVSTISTNPAKFKLKLITGK